VGWRVRRGRGETRYAPPAALQPMKPTPPGRKRPPPDTCVLRVVRGPEGGNARSGWPAVADRKGGGQARWHQEDAEALIARRVIAFSEATQPLWRGRWMAERPQIETSPFLQWATHGERTGLGVERFHVNNGPFHRRAQARAPKQHHGLQMTALAVCVAPCCTLSNSPSVPSACPQS
jgi:hypothetical protein